MSKFGVEEVFAPNYFPRCRDLPDHPPGDVTDPGRLADRDRHRLHRQCAGRRDRPLCRAADGRVGRVRRHLRTGAELGRLGRDQAALRIDGAFCAPAFPEEPRPAARQLRLRHQPPLPTLRHSAGPAAAIRKEIDRHRRSPARAEARRQEAARRRRRALARRRPGGGYSACRARTDSSTRHRRAALAGGRRSGALSRRAGRGRGPRSRDQLERVLAGMDLVSREEFEAVKAMAAKAREEQEILLKRIVELSPQLAGRAIKRRAARCQPAPANRVQRAKSP